MGRDSAKRTTGASGRPEGSRRPAARAYTPRESGIDFSADGVDRAPRRGKYDRGQSAEERRRAQQIRLLDAAAHVCAEKGFAVTTVEDVVTRAGMSRRTFYEHFGDLRDCMTTLHADVEELAFEALTQRVANASSPDDVLRRCIDAVLTGLATYPHIALVVLRELRAAGPDFEAMHEAAMQRFRRIVHDSLRDAHARGLARVAPDDLRVFVIVAALEAVGMRYVARGEADRAPEAAPVLLDIVRKILA